MTNKKIVYRIAILLSTFFVLNCGGATGTVPKKTCAEEGKLSIDNEGACFKAEAIPANFQELVDIVDKKYKADHNADLNKIDVSKVTNMKCLFANACPAIVPEMKGKSFGVFNGKIDKWDVSNVIDMSIMFRHNAVFNGDLSHWDVSKVKNMSAMFNGVPNFNSDLSKWKVGQVTDMSHMFQNAPNFNSDISGWDVSNVTTMEELFRQASKFNQNIDSWKVGKVTSVASMFKGKSATSANPAVPNAMSFPLPSWGGKLPAGVVKTDMFKLSAVAGKEPTWCTTGCK